MGNKECKEEMFTKMASIQAHHAGMLTIMHRLKSVPDIHFEIGFTDETGKSSCVYSSTSIERTITHYNNSEYSAATGYLIDVWENESPITDVTVPMAEVVEAYQPSKVMFEINKILSNGNVIAKSIEYQTVFRSTSALDCQNEWNRKEYKKEEYKMDIREAVNGGPAHYHVADIDTDTMEPARHTKEDKYGKDWLVSLITRHIDGDKGKLLGMREDLAERILQVYGDNPA